MKGLADFVMISVAFVCIALCCCTFLIPVFNIETFTVQTGSMEPAIHTGSLVYVDTEVEGHEIAPGDVIAFVSGEGHDKVCTHRVVDNDVDSQSIRTKGDANEAADASPVSYSRLTGRVVLSIPYLGYVCTYITDNRVASAGFILLIFGSASLLSWFLSKRNKPTDKRRLNNA